jgi:glycosyltransferase involved in cell wall biosynthesis
MGLIGSNYYLGKLMAAARRGALVAHNLRTISLRPAGAVQGRVLLSYMVDGFLLDPASVPRNNPAYWHTNAAETREMARTFLDLGFAVDVISWMNRLYKPRGQYDVLVDPRHNMERLANQVGPRCLKLMHLDSSHLLSLSSAELRRLVELQQRRGVTLQPRRIEPPNLGLEHADCATVLGNATTMATFRYANKPLYPVPLPANSKYPWPEARYWKSAARTFIWLGSAGLVHKGLDLVLEAFAGMPQFQLLVCGPIDGEPDFVEAYRKELYQTPNIQTVGWVDTGSREFQELTSRAIGIVYPSCSEGQAGAVVTAMHGGLVPIISRFSGVDVDGFGRYLETCTIPEIRHTIERIAELPEDDLKSMARQAWETARALYTRENYGKVFRSILVRLLGIREARQPADFRAGQAHLV